MIVFPAHLSELASGPFALGATGEAISPAAPFDAGTVSIGDVTIVEGNSGTRTATFVVTRTGLAAAFSVDFTTVDGTALAGGDYVATSGSLFFGIDQMSATIEVTINSDLLIEGNETFFVNLSSATNNAIIADAQGTGIINNDDLLPNGDDYAGDASTTGTITVGGTLGGNIGFPNDFDWFRITLTDGLAATIRVSSASTSSDTLTYPVLQIYDGLTGVRLAYDFYQSGPGADAQLMFSSNTSGIYYISVSAYNYNSDFGTYTLSVAPSFTGGNDTVSLPTSFGSNGAAWHALAGFDWVAGSYNNERIFGDDGNDTLIGGGGNDHIDGGAGFDLLDFSVGAYWIYSPVTVNLITGVGTSGDADGDTYANIELVIGTSYADTLIGSNDHNILEGGPGSDVIEGNLGNDWVSYEHASKGISITLALTVNSGWSGDATGDDVTGVENIIGSAFNDYLFGDTGANILRGGAGGDILYGAANSDTIDYSDNLVAVTVDLSTNSALGGFAQGDTLVSVENVVATAYNDSLTGDSASNTLYGWFGVDVLTGNGSNDIFTWRSVFDSGNVVGQRDTVTDFWRGHGDTLDFSGVDADGDAGNGDTVFAFIGNGAFTATGQMRYVFEGGATVIEINTDANLNSDMQVLITNGNIALLATDFAL